MAENFATESSNVISTSSLGSIAILESPAGWIKWHREISDYIGIVGYGDLLGRNRSPPAKGALSDDKWEDRKEAWHSKQDKACSAIKSRLDFNARKEVNGLDTLETVLNKLKTRYKPTGSAIFQELDRRYHELTLADCTGVNHFASQLRKARAELLELDSDCAVGEPHFVNKFLTGLGPDYKPFLTAFYQNHQLIPTRKDDGEVTAKAVTLDEALVLAEREE
ncbi:hypothetical protein K402DRAFT_343196, partial [Aulographum hederae CBS 113979]